MSTEAPTPGVNPEDVLVDVHNAMSADEAVRGLPQPVHMTGSLDFPAPTDTPHQTKVYDRDAARHSLQQTALSYEEMDLTAPDADHPAVHREGALSFLGKLGTRKHPDN